MNQKPKRIASIDIFRALTMLLMIWVNDFWTLENVPKWLKHARAGEDFLGFSDLIFPWFLYIVGLSIPFAIENRIRKGESKGLITYHIITRSVALLIMGVFHVNFESYGAEATGISRAVYIILCTAAFFMVWNRYPVATSWKKYLYPGLQFVGIAILVYLGIRYRSGGDPALGMKTQWWGILGLIGWTYLIAAPIYLFSRKWKYASLIVFVGFITLNVVADLGYSYKIFAFQGNQWFVGNGSLHTLAFGGILTSLLLMQFNSKGKYSNLYSILLLSSLFFLSVGFILHKYIIISKISGTSTWIMFSLSSAVFLYALLHWIVETHDNAHWFNLIKTAGTATLTCYLVPYFYYNFRSILHIDFDGFIVTGAVGLIKSMAYAFIIVGLTWVLGKLKIQLKV
ncbi:hypothetical protein ACFLT1_03705 [Bacteroidota bacterium]